MGSRPTIVYYKAEELSSWPLFISSFHAMATSTSHQPFVTNRQHVEYMTNKPLLGTTPGRHILGVIDLSLASASCLTMCYYS